MKYINMPGTGLVVSKACLGTMTFGGQVSEADAIGIVHAAADEGINYIDTANIDTKGESERIVGKALKGERDNWVLETKVCNVVGEGPNDNGLSRRHIMKAVEDSLTRLQTDYIDVYYLHRPDHRTPFEETMRAMDDLIHQGKVRYIGISNFAVWQTLDILNLCRAKLLNGPVIMQTVYNLLTRGIEDELLPMTEAHDMVVMVNDISREEPKKRVDTAQKKRVELHLHTRFSTLDALTDPAEAVKTAARWGHKAIAVTDHGVAQAFPDFWTSGKKNGIKIIYGLEGYFVNDMDDLPAIHGATDLPLDTDFVGFDIETTGLDGVTERITEIGAVRVVNGHITESFQTFVDPGKPIPPEIVQLTGITDRDVSARPPRPKPLPTSYALRGICPWWRITPPLT